MGRAPLSANRGATIALGVLAVLGLLPVVAYLYVVAGAPQLSVEQARQRLDASSAEIVFVEPLAETSAESFKGSRLWPVAEILQQTEAPEFRQPGRSTLLFCRGGIKSAWAARHLSKIGAREVFSVQGGMQEWIRAGGGLDAQEVRKRGISPDKAWIGFRAASGFEQGLLVFSFFGIKAIYSLMTLALMGLLWGRKAPELRSLWLALTSFFLGETCCFFNVMLYAERSTSLEYGHSLLMAVSLGQATWAALQWATPLLQSASCALHPLCGTCTKTARSACRLRRMAQLLVPLLAIVALLPCTAELQGSAYTTLVLGMLHGYGHPVLHQLFELRYLPVVACALFLSCEVTLLWGKRAAAELAPLLFSAGMGALGFSYLRMMLVAPFAHDQLWFAFWEETTELIYIGAVVAVLWLFRPSVFSMTRATP